MIYIFFLLVLLFFFYLIPFLIGYALGRGWGAKAARWGGWAVTGFYAGWMVLTWLEEGYSPVSLTRLVSLEPAVAGSEINHFITHMIVTLITFYIIYSGAKHGARAGHGRSLKKWRQTSGPSL